jgi:hypothetical protein
MKSEDKKSQNKKIDLKQKDALLRIKEWYHYQKINPQCREEVAAKTQFLI